LLLWIITAGVWLIDRALKAWIVSHLVLGKSVFVLPGVFHLTYILNAGAAFGMMAGHPGLLILLACLVLGGIFYIQRQWVPREPLPRIALGMISGGALGNLYDRITIGKVVDYLDFQIWPFIFNFADSMIVVGIAVIILCGYVKERHGREEYPEN
jgi:signal peptidase II